MSIPLEAPEWTSRCFEPKYSQDIAGWIRSIHSLNTKDTNGMRKTFEKFCAEVKCLSKFCAKIRSHQVKCLSNDDDAN